MMGERTAFEKWLISSHALSIEKYADGSSQDGMYVDPIVDSMWIAWEKRASESMCTLVPAPETNNALKKIADVAADRSLTDEQVWLSAYTACLSNMTRFSSFLHVGAADTCLNEFRKRFPRS